MAHMALPPARRLLRSALVAATIFLACGGLIGAVDATSGSGTSFVLPPVHLGDVATYAESSSEGNKTRQADVTVSWGTRDPVLLPDGQWHPLETLTARERDHDPDAYPGEQDMDVAIELGFTPAGSELQTLGVRGNFSGAVADDALVPLVRQTSTLQGGIQFLLFAPGSLGQAPECLFGGAWSGTRLSSDEGLSLPRSCLPMFASAMPGMALAPQGVDTVDGLRALHYHGTSAALLPGMPDRKSTRLNSS